MVNHSFWWLKHVFQRSLPNKATENRPKTTVFNDSTTRNRAPLQQSVVSPWGCNGGNDPPAASRENRRHLAWNQVDLGFHKVVHCGIYQGPALALNHTGKTYHEKWSTHKINCIEAHFCVVSKVLTCFNYLWFPVITSIHLEILETPHDVAGCTTNCHNGGRCFHNIPQWRFTINQ